MVNMIIMLLEFKETRLRIDQLLPFHFFYGNQNLILLHRGMYIDIWKCATVNIHCIVLSTG